MSLTNEVLNIANNISPVISSIFYKLISLSITATIAGCIILFVLKVADKKISPAWKCVLWMVFITALVIPFRIESEISVYNEMQITQVETFSYREEYEKARQYRNDYEQALIKNDYKDNSQNQIDNQAVLSSDTQINSDDGFLTERKLELEALNRNAANTHKKMLLFDFILPLLWLLGTVSILAFILIGIFRLKYKIKQTNNIKEHSSLFASLNNILKKHKVRLKIKNDVGIIIQKHVKSPALFGLFKPQIILPEYIDELSDESKNNVILHELIHYKRRDMWLNALLLILQAIYWFNPLVWVLFHLVRKDMEVATDARAIQYAESEGEQKQYSISLVEVLCRKNHVSFLPRILCMVDNEKNIERRLKMINKNSFFKRKKWLIATASILIISLIGVLFLTNRPGGNNPLSEQASRLYSYKTDSIVSNEKAVEIIKILPEIDGLEYKEVIVNNKTNEIILSYRANSETVKIYKERINQTELMCNAVLLFSLIDNLNTVYYEFPKDKKKDMVKYDRYNMVNPDMPSQGNICKLLSPTIKKTTNDYILTESKLVESSRTKEEFQQLLMATSAARSSAPPVFRIDYKRNWKGKFGKFYEDEKFNYYQEYNWLGIAQLKFLDGTIVDLPEALEKQLINIDDLLSHNLYLNIKAKRDTNKGTFKGYCKKSFSLDDITIYPSKTFMYVIQKGLWKADYYFNLKEVCAITNKPYIAPSNVEEGKYIQVADEWYANEKALKKFGLTCLLAATGYMSNDEVGEFISFGFSTDEIFIVPDSIGNECEVRFDNKNSGFGSGSRPYRIELASGKWDSNNNGTLDEVILYGFYGSSLQRKYTQHRLKLLIIDGVTKQETWITSEKFKDGTLKVNMEEMNIFKDKIVLTAKSVTNSKGHYTQTELLLKQGKRKFVEKSDKGIDENIAFMHPLKKVSFDFADSITLVNTSSPYDGFPNILKSVKITDKNDIETLKNSLTSTFTGTGSASACPFGGSYIVLSGNGKTECVSMALDSCDVFVLEGSSQTCWMENPTKPEKKKKRIIIDNIFKKYGVESRWK